LSNSEDAKQLLNNAVFIQSFANVREALVSQLESCPLDDDQFRNQLVLCLQLLPQIKQDIEMQVNLFNNDSETPII
jgi:hypothetical protein